MTANKIMKIDEAICTQKGINSRPAGKEFCFMILDMVRGIIENDLADKIENDDLEILTNENFHSARFAAEIAKRIWKESSIF
jgi:hypothetical protein